MHKSTYPSAEPEIWTYLDVDPAHVAIRIRLKMVELKLLRGQVLNEYKRSPVLTEGFLDPSPGSGQDLTHPLLDDVSRFTLTVCSCVIDYYVRETLFSQSTE